MAITARELVFYVRAEDQASRVVKRVARSFGSLSNIRALENKGILQQAANLRAVDKAQQSILRNQVSLQRARVQASRLDRLTTGGKTVAGYTAAETAELAAAARRNVVNLQKQEKILGENLDEVRRKGLAASAAIDQQISQAKIDRIRSYATEVQNLGRAIRLVGVIGLASFAFAAHAAANLSTQVALAASQARPPGTPAGAALPIQAKVQSQIIQQMQKFPATAEEMSNSFYQIFSGTNIQSVKTAANYVKLFNEAAVGGGASLDEMTQAGISMKNVFGVGGVGGEFKNMTEALNVFFSAVRYGRMTASQFASALGYITPIAKDVKLSMRSIAADMAFFTRQTGGNMTRQDAQGLARLIQLLAREDVVKGLATKGIPVFDKLTGRMRPVVDIIKQIHDQLRLTPQQTVNFFKTISAAGGSGKGTQGTIQAIRIFSQGIQNVKAYQDVVRHVSKDNDEFINSYNQLSKAPGVRWKVFTNQIKAAILVIGGEAIPAFIKLGEPIARLIHWFNGLDDSTKHMIATVGVFGSAAAILGGTLLIVAGSLARLALTIKELRLLSLASQAGSASAAFGLFGGALVLLLVVLYKYPHAFDGIIHALGGMKNAIAALTLAMIAIKFRAFITGLLGMQTAMVAAQAEAATLAATLTSIATMGIIGVTVVVTYEAIVHRKGISKVVSGVVNSGLRALGIDVPKNDKKLSYNQALALAGQRAKAFHMPFNEAAEQTLTPEQWRQFNARPPSARGDVAQKVNAFHGRIAAAAAARAASAARNKVNPVTGMSPATWNSQKAIDQVLELYKLTQKAPTQANFKKYYQTLANLRKHYTGVDLQALDSYLSAVESATNKSSKKVASNAKKAAEVLKQQLTDAQANVMSMYDTLLQQNQSVMGQIFQGPYSQSGPVQNRLQYGGLLGGGDLLKDLQSQNTQFTTFFSTIDKLRKRGAPNELIQQLIQAGPQALPAIKALSGMGDQQWKVYIKTFNKGQDLLHKQTLVQLKMQLKDYRKYGQGIALQIIMGMRDKRMGLANEIKSIIKNMFGVTTPLVTPAAKKKIADATKAAATKPHHQPHGAYTGQTTHTKPVVGTGTRTTQSVNHYHYEVTAPKSEHTSVETQLRHAEFVSRTKYKGHH